MNTPVNPGSLLNWTQPSSLERHFELRADNNLCGTLHFDSLQIARGSLTSPDAITRNWTFTRKGFFSRKVIIREDGTEEDLAIYSSRVLGDGWLEFTTKSRFYWHTTNYLGTQQGFANEQDDLIFVLRPKFFTLLKVEASVEIAPQWHNLDELPVLLLFGWFLMVGSQYAGRT